MTGKPVEIPIYDFVNHNRYWRSKSRLDKTELVHPTKIVIFEGILAFYDKKINTLMNIKIFVDSDGDVRLARRCESHFESSKARHQGEREIDSRGAASIQPIREASL